MKLTGRFLCLAAFIAANGISAARAAGTPAGTVISNTATLSYAIGDTPGTTITSAPATLTVDEVIDLTLAWQNAGPVAVSSPGTNDALAFLLTNTGNGPESFRLARSNAVAGDDYDPQNGSAGSILLESGLAPGLQLTGPNADTGYVAGVNDPALFAGTSRVIYVLSDTPSGFSIGNTGLVALTADATTPGAAGAAPGTSLAGLGQGGVDAVVGANSAQATRHGSYLVGGLTVDVQKTVAAVLDPRGGASVEPGSILTYRLTVTLNGTGTATGLAISDPLPAEMTYLANSILVNGAARTDAADADNAQFSGSTVTIHFGDTPAPVVHVIEFRATVN